MIAPDSRSLEWIEKVAAENHAPNLILVEKIPASFSSRLNLLKGQNPEAFFYWVKTTELMK